VTSKSIIDFSLNLFRSSSLTLSHLVHISSRRRAACAICNFCIFVYSTLSRSLARSLAHSCIKRGGKCFAALSRSPVCSIFATQEKTNSNENALRPLLSFACKKTASTRENNIQEEDLTDKTKLMK
jgi:hypothetical protein